MARVVVTVRRSRPRALGHVRRRRAGRARRSSACWRPSGTAGLDDIPGSMRPQKSPGAPYPPEEFREDAGVLEGVDVLGDVVADTLGRAPTAMCCIDCPPVVGSSTLCRTRHVPHRPADPARRGCEGRAVEAIEHFQAVAPWHAQLDSTERPTASRSRGRRRRGLRRRRRSDARRVWRDVTLQGQGGSIPLCTVLQETFPTPRSCCSGWRSPAPDRRCQRERGSDRNRKDRSRRGAFLAEVRAGEALKASDGRLRRSAPFIAEDFARRMERRRRAGGGRGPDWYPRRRRAPIWCTSRLRPIAMTEPMTMFVAPGLA